MAGRSFDSLTLKMTQPCMYDLHCIPLGIIIFKEKAKKGLAFFSLVGYDIEVLALKQKEC